jgi:hypothetical protein
MGASSKRAVRFFAEGDAVVRLSTIEKGSEVFREECVVPSVICGGNGRLSRGDSGENEGNEVKDLSEEAIDDAELDIYDEYFLGFTRTVPDR